MCLFDTLDGCFMNFAYDWAFSHPVRKVFYNLTITGLSVAVAFFIGTIEILGLIAQEANLNSPLWHFVRGFNINMAGYVIVGVFAVTWVAAWAYWRLARVEERVVLEPGVDPDELVQAP
jgi:high-affinity nickel-transport protein